MSRPGSPLRLSWANTLQPALGQSGVDPSEFEGPLARRAVQARRRVGGWVGADVPGFHHLPSDPGLAEAVRAEAAHFRPGATDLVLVGIGGSSLGAEALLGALAPEVLVPAGAGAGSGLRVHVLDNPDPDSVRRLLSTLDPRRTVVNVVSKSGGTVEMLAGFLVLEEAFARALDPEGTEPHRWRDRFLLTTDPDKGFLRHLVRRDGFRSLPVPPEVGGRFSVLSAVGLFPAAMAGLDPAALLSGAGRVLAVHDAPGAGPGSDPSATLALLLHRLHLPPDDGPHRSVHVVMPYGDRLRRLALWVQQLWGESLGKRDEVEGRGTGPTPLAAAGARDQHSLLQLFMEGPDDRVVVFVSAEGSGPDIAIPDRYPGESVPARLAGHGLGELLAVERLATAEALRRAGRPSLHLALGGLDEASIGGFFMLWQLATLHAAALYGVDPFGQPGVELGKRLTGHLLDRRETGPDEPLLPDGVRPEDAGGATWPPTAEA